MAKRRCFIFAGGGTGGHLMPGLAIAERLTELDAEVEAVFLCSDRPLDAEILTEAGVRFHPLPARPMVVRPFPRGPLGFLRGWRRAGERTKHTIRELQSAGLDVQGMVAMGGYVAAPAASTARKLEAGPTEGTNDRAGRSRLPILLVNLDAVPGKANRLIARWWADDVVSAVPCPGFKRFEPVVGMPIRRSAVNSDAPAECRRRLGLAPDRPTLLITGASQGAGSLNELMIQLCRTRPDVLSGWQVLHLTGSQHEEEARQAYPGAVGSGGSGGSGRGESRRPEVPAVVMSFCSRMADAWGAADLALSRAGASSVAEAAANAVPTVFAPYPWHRDQHQKHNARPLVDAGGAWLVTDHVDAIANLESIGATLGRLLTHEEERDEAKRRLLDRPKPDAALAIARQLLGGAPAY